MARYCIDPRCRQIKRTQVHKSMAAALKQLATVARLGGKAQAKQHELEQCGECQLWRLRRW